MSEDDTGQEDEEENALSESEATKKDTADENVDADTHHALSDPIQDELWNHTCFHLVVQNCFQTHSYKEQIQRSVHDALPKPFGSLSMTQGHSLPRPSSH